MTHTKIQLSSPSGAVDTPDELFIVTDSLLTRCVRCVWVHRVPHYRSTHSQIPFVAISASRQLVFERRVARLHSTVRVRVSDTTLHLVPLAGSMKMFIFVTADAHEAVHVSALSEILTASHMALFTFSSLARLCC